MCVHVVPENTCCEFIPFRVSPNTDPTCRQRFWNFDCMALYKFDYYAPAEGALSDDARLTSVSLTSDVCRVHRV